MYVCMVFYSFIYLSFPFFLRGIDNLGELSTLLFKGYRFCDFLFAFLHIMPLLKRSTFKEKKLLPRGANSSFLLEKILFRRDIK